MPPKNRRGWHPVALIDFTIDELWSSFKTNQSPCRRCCFFLFFSVMELSFSSCCIACTHLSEPAFVILQKLASLYSISFFFFWEFHVMQFAASLLIIQYVWKFTETPWFGRLHPATVQSIGNIGCHWFHFFPALQTKFRNSVIQNFNPSISHYALTNRFSMYKLSSMDKNQTGPLMMFPRPFGCS